MKSVKSDVETLAAQTTADKNAAESAKNDAEAARDIAVSSQEAAESSATTALAAQKAAETARDDAQASKESAASDAQAAETAKTDAETALEGAEAAKADAADSASAAEKSAEKAQQYSGKPPKIDPETRTWWIWDAEAGDYYDTHMTSEIQGPIGIGIEDIVLTEGNHMPGTTDIYTVTLTNGTEYTISVYNGRNGEGAGDVLGIWFDLTIPVDGWIDGEATVSDERLIALATHKYLVDSDSSCRDEYEDCHVRAKDITQNGQITFASDTDPSMELIVNVVRLELSANG